MQGQLADVSSQLGASQAAAAAVESSAKMVRAEKEEFSKLYADSQAKLQVGCCCCCCCSCTRMYGRPFIPMLAYRDPECLFVHQLLSNTCVLLLQAAGQEAVALRGQLSESSGSSSSTIAELQGKAGTLERELAAAQAKAGKLETELAGAVAASAAAAEALEAQLSGAAAKATELEAEVAAKEAGLVAQKEAAEKMRVGAAAAVGHPRATSIG
eukprot:SAG22_NODE_246_length_13948_cov_12.055744_7_plen_213_part_00